MIKRNLPLMITLGVFVLGYLYCLTQFPAFASTRVICNILTDNAFLGIIAVGMTFVILSGGIDLSVGSVIAFTGVFLAKAIGYWGISPLLAFPLVLLMGCAFGAFMGLLIDALKIPAFIITLAGMSFLRGVSYLISEESIPINHPVYDTLSSLAWKIPGGGRLSAMGLLMLAVLLMGPTLFLVDTLTATLGSYLHNLVNMSLRLTPFREGTWVADWTLFYWAWWVTWAPFVGMFIARISRGRTIREFIIGVMLVPSLMSFAWFAVFGGTALHAEIFGQFPIVAAVQADVADALFKLLELLPGAGLAGAGSTEGRTVFQDRKPDCRGSGKCKGRHCGPL